VLRYKFRQQNRLKSPKEFQSVFDHNQIRVGSPSILILAKPNQLEISRLGLVIRKKFVRFAHDRNRVKRIVRESFRHSQSSFPGLDCVVLTRPGAGDMANKELRNLLDEMFTTLANKNVANKKVATNEVANKKVANNGDSSGQ
jgi:ribonuclease P protein component